MLATSKAVAKQEITLLGQKEPGEQVELDPKEGPFESWLAVTQDMWGIGNLTPLDGIFASTAVWALTVTNKGCFGVVCYHLGDRLFRLSREVDAWIDAYECEPAVSRIQKRPKDKIKLHAWNPEKCPLAKNRYLKLAALNVSRIPGATEALAHAYADSLKSWGDLFLADLVSGKDEDGATSPVRFGDRKLQSLASHKKALTEAGIKLCNEYDLTNDTKGAIRRGLYNSLNMLVNVRQLKEPWKSQRLAAYYRELEALSNLYNKLENGEVKAIGILAQKP